MYINEWGVDDICILLGGVWMIYITGWGVDDICILLGGGVDDIYY